MNQSKRRNASPLQTIAEPNLASNWTAVQAFELRPLCIVFRHAAEAVRTNERTKC